MSLLWYLANVAVPESRQPHVLSLLWPAGELAGIGTLLLMQGSYMERNNQPGSEMRVFCEQHNQVVPRLVLAQLYQLLCPHFAVYEPPRLCLGDEQHPKIAANKMRAIKTRQKMPITTSPPRVQPLVAIRVFRSSGTEDVSCSTDVLFSILLGPDNNRVRCCILSMPSATPPKPVQVCMVSVPAGTPPPKGGSLFTEMGV